MVPLAQAVMVPLALAVMVPLAQVPSYGECNLTGLVALVALGPAAGAGRELGDGEMLVNDFRYENLAELGMKKLQIPSAERNSACPHLVHVTSQLEEDSMKPCSMCPSRGAAWTSESLASQKHVARS